MSKLLSASRLNQFLGCAHRAALWLDGVEEPDEADASLELVRRKGFEHEAVVLAELEAIHGPAISIPETAPLAERVRLTLEAIRAEAPLIYQGAFANHRWLGFPDFLVRKTSADGRPHYEPEDAKLAREAKAEHLLQLGIYSALLHEATGAPFAESAIHVGAREQGPARFDLRKTRFITARLMRTFEAFVDQPKRETRPLPCAECARCGFSGRCEAEWRAADSPTFVAGMRLDQMLKLEAAGVTTLSALAAMDPSKPLGGVGKEAFAKLVNQARLQKAAEAKGEHAVELLQPEPGRGFHILPEPAAGDLFFDMEGDPLFPEGLEYLFGLWGPLGPQGEDTFHPIWAHDRAEEKVAFEALMDLFETHLQRFPTARIYHYAPYEPAALKRLAMRHATREAKLDQMLREERFVDLYRVARQAIRASTEGYSLKDLEKIYWGQRSGEVTNAGDSIVEYERWREVGDPAILEAIGHYNEDDCVSTARMRDWLVSLRPGGAVFDLKPQPEEPLDAKAIEWREKREAFEIERQRIAHAIRSTSELDDHSRDLIAELLWFHQRSQKPQWWAIFDRQTWTDDELIEDFESLGGLELHPDYPVYQDKRSFVATYRFEPQDTKLKEGDRCKIALTGQSAGTIVDLDVEEGRVVLRRGTAAGDFPERCSLVPGSLIDQSVLVEGVVSLAKRVAAGDTSGDQALLDLIARRHPRIHGLAPGDPVVPPRADLLNSAIDTARRLANSYLIIQGPPGTGKTYTASKVILSLLRDGKRVAVSSNAHKAIHNLLSAVEEGAADQGFAFKGAKMASRQSPEARFDGALIKTVHDLDELTDKRLVAGTAFHFAKPEELRQYDYLFVDEAGQVSLGNLAAMSGCARNLVLIGDQMQLPQPVQGVHPGQSGLSCLDYAMQGHATVPRDRGILLDTSRRMHRDVCDFISAAFYDERLQAHPSTNGQRLVLDETAHPILRPTGLRVLEVDHEANVQTSPEEAEAIAAVVQSLLGQRWTNAKGDTKPVRLDDILIVAPFNAQVQLLARTLPAGARVGTVDKFQGQEAAVVLVSMTTSHGADAPRGSEFLFNPNRLNVALSRARCLAILVRGRHLLDLAPGTIDDLVRLDRFAFADEFSSSQRSTGGPA